MEQQKTIISLDNFKPMRVMLKAANSSWVSNRMVVKPIRLQSWGNNGTLITLELRQVWNTQRYSSKPGGKVIETSIHISAQRQGQTKWLPVIKCPLDFQN
jgi:hypothetical protein